jgi:uncharacterized protein DUF6748
MPPIAKIIPLTLSLTLLFTLPACGGTAPTGERSTDDEDAISTRTEAYVSVLRDLRRCVAPLCGGYFIHEVNRNTATRYVSGLDFSRTQLDDTAIASIPQAADDQILLKGRLGPSEPRFHTRPLLVTEAYLGLPGITAASTDPDYAIAMSALSDELSAKKLNSRASAKAIARVSVDMIGAFVPQQWLLSRIEQHDAKVAGQITEGDAQAQEPEKILQAGQVFIRLPDRVGPCPARPVQSCPEGQVQTYTMSPDRCLIPDACVTQGICPFALPRCDDGYSGITWVRSPNACTTVACYPAFAD